ncbi:efflux RND transporter periplasmic adaptor subunit [Algibacter mikhailovii]|uniref:efflux RND transporter periplasmic adaptor subunit n=1 Tax=Algibacter mikhailovii TaxID=425498 RepID=UPI0024957865|nr:efflux RND transporter periplasmic adaptor subunit [Algibacter mikhailovii]
MKKYIYVLTLLLIFLSCKSDYKKNINENAPYINVKISHVNNQTNSPFLSVSGKIKSVMSADLSTRIMGYVNKVHVNVGDTVKKGQLLISINNADLQAKQAQVNANISEATAAFNIAEKDFIRFKNLFSEESASQKEMDDMTAHFEMAKARLEGAYQMKNEIEAQFAYSNITAPFNGVITGKHIETGNMASPGAPLISLENPNNFEVIAMVPETEISEITKGSEVTVIVNSINKTLKGIISEISGSAKHTGGQYLIKIVLVKTDINILSGMFATVQFPVQRKSKSDLVLIPYEAIIENGQLSGLYTINENNTAILRWLRIGRRLGNQVEVLSGLKNGEAYILSADGKLFNGAKVKPYSTAEK